MGNFLGLGDRKEYQGQTDLVSVCLGTQASLPIKIKNTTTVPVLQWYPSTASATRLDFLTLHGPLPLCTSAQSDHLRVTRSPATTKGQRGDVLGQSLLHLSCADGHQGVTKIRAFLDYRWLDSTCSLFPTPKRSQPFHSEDAEGHQQDRSLHKPA